MTQDTPAENERQPESPPHRRTTHWLVSVCCWLLLLLLLAAAVAATTLRHLADTIDQHRPAIEQILSDRLGQNLEIDELSARWQGMNPVLQVSGIRIEHAHNSPDTAASLQHLLLQLDGLRSLIRFGLVFERIEADGLDLSVIRDERGVRLRGIELPSGERAPDPAREGEHNWYHPSRLFDELADRIANPRIRLTHVSLGIHAPATAPVYVDIPQLNLVYRHDEFSASGRAMRRGTVEQLATFAVKGRDLLEGRFTGDAWFDITPGGILEGLTRGLNWKDLEILELEANARTWLKFEEGALVSLNGKLELPRLQLRNTRQTLPALEDLSAELGWQRREGEDLLTVSNLQWKWLDDRVAGIDALIERDRLNVRIRAARLPVGAAGRLAEATGMLSARLQAELAAYQPEGELTSLALTIPVKLPKEFELAAVFSDIEVQPHQGAPGGRNLQGQAWLSRHGGRALLEGQQMSLQFPGLFANPWILKTARGEVNWRLDGGITRVFARDLELTYGEDARMSGAFDLRLDRYGEDNLGLRVQLENGSASMLADFVPVGIVGEDLYDWLTTAVTNGNVETGELHAHGQIGSDVPRSGFSTAMVFRFSNASIAYDPAWPEVSDASGELAIHNGDARISLAQASTGGLVLDGAEVAVTGPDDGPAEVRVTTRSRINGERVAYWLAETPVGSMIGETGERLRVSGDYDLNLGLVIPMATNSPVAVDAAFQTGNGRVDYDAAGLSWTDISGGLRYSSDNGLTGEPLSARFLGEPVSVVFSGSPEQSSVEVTQTGQADIQELTKRLLSKGTGLPGLEGRLPYTARLETSRGNSGALSIRANGAGLWSEWPSPLAREAGAEEALEATLAWRDQAVALRGRWGERLGVAARWTNGVFRSGEVTLGQASAEEPEQQGLLISGYLDRFEPMAWQPWIKKLGSLGAQPLGEDGAGQAATRISDSDWLNRIELTATEVLLGDALLPGLKATIAPEAGGWLITTESEQVAGRITVPADGDVVWVDLSRLRLGADAEPGEPEAAGTADLPSADVQVDAFRGMATENWPEVDVRIESLELGSDPMGGWSFVMVPERERLVLRDLQGRMGSLAFDGQMAWGITAGEQVTSLRGVIEGGGLQNLESLRGETIPLENESSILDLDLAWRGRPDQFDVSRLNGEFTVRLDEGVILENNNTAQLFRIFNLLNTDTLQRRLKFDFSDLYEAGVAFDAIYGKARVQEGVLRWDPDLQLAGPSGALRLSGTTDLADETLDMRLVVILPLTQNLPLAAILMGASPPIGGALFVLDKLLGEPLSKLTSATYSVKGSWDSPEVRLRNIFDSGNQD